MDVSPVSPESEAVAGSMRFADAVLVRRVQAGEQAAFAELVRKYQDRVYRACLRICGNAEDAADLTQDAFLKAYSSIGRFRGASAFYTWIFRIAVNRAISQQRKARTRATVSLNGDGEKGALAEALPEHREPQASERMAARETHAQVAAALQAIDDDYRVVLVLRDVEGCDYQKIADILEVPVGTVKSRVFRGRLALRARLDELSDANRKRS